MTLYDPRKYYADFSFPWELEHIVELNLEDFDAWFVMDSMLGEDILQDFQVRYPMRKLIPFAKRADCDDVACFEIGKPNVVTIIHNGADSGWEQREEFHDFWAWFQSAIDVMVERAKEEAECLEDDE